ncbi:LysE family transporter [candidate division KSB1 bacterium]|nr:LysE family transporter [candidate division KSB1 bacterium]
MLLTAVTSFIIWFILAIPVGAIQIEIARRAFNGYLKSAFAIVLGSVLSDFIYGVIAMLGLYRFLENPKVQPFFWLIGSILLAILGVLAFRHYTHPHEISVTKHLLKKKRLAFVTGFLVAASNPLMIVGWLTGAKLAQRWGAMADTNLQTLCVFIIFGALGLGAYLSLLTFILYRVRRFLSERMMRLTSLIFSLVLFALAIYFFIEAILIFTGNGSNLEIKPNISLFSGIFSSGK